MGEGGERDKWGSKIDFILSCLGYAVGLGNVWRFPNLCGRSGGAAFLIPYVIMMIFAGMPTFYLELAIGQYSGVTPHLLYRRMCPVFAGIGYTMITISVITGIYYNMVIAWSMYYFGVSFAKTLPWRYCNQEWGTEYCWDDVDAPKCKNDTEGFYSYWFNKTCTKFETRDQYEAAVSWWDTNNEDLTSPASEYLKIRVLHDSGTISNIGTPQWELVVCLACAWILVFACLFKGIKSSGKVVWFTATFPYVILFILLIRGCTLPGAGKGISFYILEPNVSKLAEGKVWGDAAQQIFFSLSLGGGGLATLASYNEFNNNLLRDTLIVVLGNCGTSIFAGFVIFPIIGYMSHVTGRPVAELAKGGTTLAFQAYPSALVQLWGAPFWAILFFFMLIILGIDSQLVIVEVVITCIIDQWPSLRDWRRKILVVAGVCTASFIVGLVFTCPGGQYVLDLLDTYAGGWTLVMACLTEVCMVSYAYGVRRFIKDIRLMMGKPENTCWKVLGYPVNPYWWINWVSITPILLTAVLIFSWATYELPEKDQWTGGLGWFIALFCVSFIPIGAIIMTIVYVVQKKKPVKWLITPSKLWGPNDEAARQALAQEHNMKPYAGTGQVHPAGQPPPQGYYQ